VAELELEATRAYALMLGQLAHEAAQLQAQARARGQAQLSSIRPPLLLQLTLQLQLRCRGWHNFLRCAGKEDPSTMEVGPARKNNSNSGR
jgi:hypothetical protein